MREYQLQLDDSEAEVPASHASSTSSTLDDAHGGPPSPSRVYNSLPLDGNESVSVIAPLPSFPSIPSPTSKQIVVHQPRLTSIFWLMFGLLATVLVLAESSRGVVIPTLALYEQSLGGSSTFLGVIVALFSVGRLGSSYAYGVYLRRSTRRAARSSNPNASMNQSIIVGLLSSLLIVFIGHVFYILAVNSGLSMLLLARLLVGFGTGTLVLARTFVADHVPANKKARFMAWLGILQFVGFAFTPGLGAITFDNYIGKLHITSFNFGSYLLAFLTGLTMCGLFLIGRWMRQQDALNLPEPPPEEDDSPPETPEPLELATVVTHAPVAIVAPSPRPAGLMVDLNAPPRLTLDPLPSGTPDSTISDVSATSTITPSGVSVSSSQVGSRSSLWMLVIGNLVIRGSLSIAETYGSLIYFLVIGKGDDDEVEDSAEFFLLLGMGGVAIFLAVEYIVKRITSRWTLILSLFLAVVGYALLMDFDGDLHQGRFIVGMVLIWSCSSPMAQTTIATQLSAELALKQAAAAAAAAQAALVVGSAAAPLPPTQALWMGHLTAAGSVGRIIFPLIGGALWSESSTGGVMAIGVIAHALLAVAYVFLHHRQLATDLKMTGARLCHRVRQHELAARLMGGSTPLTLSRQASPPPELDEEEPQAHNSPSLKSQGDMELTEWHS